MKRIIAAALAAMLLLSACSNNNGESSSSPSSSSQNSSSVLSPSSSESSSNVVSSELASSSSAAPSSSAASSLSPAEGTDTKFTLKDGVYTKVTGTVAVMVVPKDFSSLGDDKKIEKAEKDLAKTTMDKYYKEGYYCIVAIPKPDSGATFDLDKKRSDFQVRIIKKQKDLSPSSNTNTYNGVSVSTLANLKDQSLNEYLNTQIEKANEK